MAKTDSKAWYETLHGSWGFEDLDKLRSNKKFIIGQVPVLKALESLVSDDTQSPFLHIILPFERCKNFHGCVVVLPQSIKNKFKNVTVIRELDKPILYTGTFYSLDEFVSISPTLGSSKKPFCSFALPLHLFMLSTAGFNSLRKDFLVKIRSAFLKVNIFQETRGKIKPVTQEQKERNDFIINEYLVSKRKKPLPIARIRDKWEEYLRKEYPNQNADARRCDDSTIRRTINDYIKK